jgi:hypothetical protein
VSDGQARLHVGADWAASNHIDDSRNRGKGKARRRQSAGGTEMSAIGVVPFGSVWAVIALANDMRFRTDQRSACAWEMCATRRRYAFGKT